MMKCATPKKGFSLVEVILATTLFALVVTALSGVFIYGQQSLILAGNRARAVLLAQEAIAAVRNMRDSSFLNLIDGTHGLVLKGGQFEFDGESDQNGLFTRVITISTIDPDRKNLQVSITWQQNLQRTGSLLVTVQLTNWRK